MLVEPHSWLSRFSCLGTRLFTLFAGSLVGKDSHGNRYYRERQVAKGVRPKRWVIYKNRPEASLVPPQWHSWLHYTTEAPLEVVGEFYPAWVKPHQPNLTFTAAAYLPPGHYLEGSARARASDDYQAWKP